MRKTILRIAWAVAACCAAGCAGHGGDGPTEQRYVHDELNAMYYWKTEFRVDSAELHFLERHNVERLYVRFFDVVADDRRVAPGRDVIPNATIRFVDEIPERIKSVVPTVYITVEAMRAMKGDESGVAEKIVERVANMISYNEIWRADELQLDCDWTYDTCESYFKLCRAVRNELRSRFELQMPLSSTIRLHQLRQAAPPVDYGVLMMYNTGSFKNPDARNSILDAGDVRPYLKRDVKYGLHLDVAYPAYGWTLAYRDGRFVGIVRSDSTVHERHEIENPYLENTVRNAQIAPRQTREGDYLRQERPDMGTVLEVRRLVERRLFSSGEPHSTIIYHLDLKQLSNYTDYEISRIYSGDSI